MPFEGSQFDELLNGFLDGELSAEELRLVQKTLDANPELRDRLEMLSSLSVDLKAAFAANKPSPLASDFSTRVVFEAQRQAAAANVVVIDAGGLSWKYLGATLAALAAIVLLAVFGPRIVSTSPESHKLADVSKETSATEPVGAENPMIADASPTSVLPSSEKAEGLLAEPPPAGQRFVSGMDFTNHIVLVLDLEMSVEAKNRDALKELLRKHGLLRAKPIEANEEIKQAVAETRMIVQPQGFDSTDASIYFIRSGVDVLGAALDEIYLNREDFPKVAFDIAMDNSQARLLEAIAKASGERFAVNEAFAVPVTSGVASSPFQVAGSTRYVSSEQRSQGFGDSATLIGGNDLSTVMILVRDEY